MNVFVTDVLLPVKMAVLITLDDQAEEHVCMYYMALSTVQVHKFANGRSIGQALRTSHTNLSCFLDVSCLDRKGTQFCLLLSFNGSFPNKKFTNAKRFKVLQEDKVVLEYVSIVG
jgi:hypothetical protein